MENLFLIVVGQHQNQSNFQRLFNLTDLHGVAFLGDDIAVF